MEREKNAWDGPENLQILKKSQLRLDQGGRQLSFCHWGESWILTVERCSWDFRISTDRDLKHHGMRRAFVGSA